MLVDRMRTYVVSEERLSIKQKMSEVDRLADIIKTYKTVGLIDLRTIPASLVRSVSRLIKENGGFVKVLNLSSMKRAFKKVGIPEHFYLNITFPCAIVLSQESPFVLNKMLKQKSKKKAAKPGDVSPYDIIVPAGETEFPPGPILSELKIAGLNVQVKGGKIVIVEDSTVAKKGDVLNDAKAKALQKLNILPFETKTKLCLCYDGEYILTADLLNMDETICDDICSAEDISFSLAYNISYPVKEIVELLLPICFEQALSFGMGIKIYSEDTIKNLLTGAYDQGVSISESVSGAGAQENIQERVEDKK